MIVLIVLIIKNNSKKKPEVANGVPAVTGVPVKGKKVEEEESVWA